MIKTRKQPLRRRTLVTAGGTLLAAPLLMQQATLAQGATISFSGWQAWTFGGITPTRYGASGSTLSIDAQGSSSVLYGVVPRAARQASRAAWQWQVSQGVGPTDLARRGGDDRAIALYFVFVDEATAARFSDTTPSMSRLMGMRGGRTLIYVWGGNAARGAILNSPYLRSRGKTVVLRPAGTGAWIIESVDLAADYARAFGGRKETLVALGVSSDSDDTNAVNRAAIRNLVLS